VSSNDWASRVVQAYASHDPARVAALFTEDAVRIEYAAPGAELRGREAIARQIAAYMHAVPDCELEAVRVSVDGNRRILEWRFSGTHSGELPNLPARGARLELAGVSVCQMDDELIRHERSYFDAAALLASARVL
jgi:steroid delta-isomerase-like uncharacterized protein